MKRALVPLLALTAVIGLLAGPASANVPAQRTPAGNAFEGNGCYNGYSTNSVAYRYLDIFPKANGDYGYCPAPGMFEKRHGYRAAWMYQTNVYDDYGWILVRASGECSYAPPTGWAWDFLAACLAHDYCYDLRRAGWSLTVTDNQCDKMLNAIAVADCNNRGSPVWDLERISCDFWARGFYGEVSEFWNTVNASSPPIVSFQAQSSGECIDIDGGSAANNIRAIQYYCTGTANQEFRTVPAAWFPGSFNLVATHSNKCLTFYDGNPDLLGQYDCHDGYINQAWRLVPVGVTNRWTIRSSVTRGWDCADVEGNSLMPLARIIHWPCWQTPNQIWKMS